jgi:hypothetical protein
MHTNTTGCFPSDGMVDPKAVPPIGEILTDEENARLKALTKQADDIRAREAEETE